MSMSVSITLVDTATMSLLTDLRAGRHYNIGVLVHGKADKSEHNQPFPLRILMQPLWIDQKEDAGEILGNPAFSEMMKLLTRETVATLLSEVEPRVLWDDHAIVGKDGGINESCQLNGVLYAGLHCLIVEIDEKEVARRYLSVHPSWPPEGH